MPQGYSCYVLMSGNLLYFSFVYKKKLVHIYNMLIWHTNLVGAEAAVDVPLTHRYKRKMLPTFSLILGMINVAAYLFVTFAAL